MSTQIASSCQACEGKMSPYGDRSYFFMGSHYGLGICDQCGLISSHPIPENHILSEFYSKHFSYKWYSDNLVWKIKDAKKRFTELRDHIGNSCLDFGGGLGYFSQVCRENGIDSATEDLQTPAKNENRVWKTVVSFHCVEHSNNLQSLVGVLKNKLEVGGTLILAVPNSKSSSYRRLGMGAVWAQPPGIHIHHFSESSVRALLDKDFEVVEVRFFDRWDANFLADSFLVKITRFMDSMWNKTQSDFLKKTAALTTGLYRNILLVFSNLLPLPPAHKEELLVVCRRRS